MLNKLKYWLKPIDVIFDDFNGLVLDDVDKTKRRIFIDHGADILFVAHLDTVIEPRFIRKTRKRIYATGLDDRLGCLIAYELSEQLNADLLLTDNEESFKSTAQYHNYKDYKWIVEFDRYHDDVVVYDCGSIDFKVALMDYWKIGIGSFSDISVMNVTCCCMNLGIGYYNAHGQNSYCVIKQVYRQIEKLKLFYAKYKNTAFIRDVLFQKWAYVEDVISGGYCEICGWNGGVEIHGYRLCADCLRAMVNQYLFCENESSFSVTDDRQ